MRKQYHIIGSFLLMILLVGFLGCGTEPITPQARTFATLKAAGAGIDSFRKDYEAAWDAKQLSKEDFTKLDVAFNKANKAIIAAAEALDAGMQANTPEGVTKLVNELMDLVLQLVPQKYQTNTQSWRL